MNNPLRFNDPTGHSIDCAIGEHECLAGKRVPDWWRSSKEHIYIDGYGYFDTGHIRRGWNSGNYLLGLNLEEKGGEFPMSSGNYHVQYSVSENVAKDDLVGVLYGIYTDFEYSYEQHQGHKIPDFASSFTPEDLPSDHVGFWAAMNGKSKDDLPDILESLGKVSTRPGLGMVDPFGLVKNHEFLPMVDERIRPYGVQRVNVSWPSWLVINPISSGTATWQRLEK